MDPKANIPLLCAGDDEEEEASGGLNHLVIRNARGAQVPCGGTHLNGVGSELTIFLSLLRSLFVSVGFVYS